MEKYNCLIVEDEPLAAEILKDYVDMVPFLDLVAVCHDAIYAIDVLHQEKIDLMFLDLNLPKLKGFDFLKTLKNPPQVIITTAYHEYALKGYEFNVVDYLMKPIALDRFLVAVNKLKQPTAPSPTPMTSHEKERAFMFFNVGKKKVKVYFDEILYIESVKEYINVVTINNSVSAKFQMGQIEELLPKDRFLRIHRSFIAAKDKIDAFSATDVEINRKLLPIGRSYKELVLSIIEK
ncbi:LytR/AlgR family response regulator transcription factor [Flavobacterium caeni]|uniref:Two component transcriptional regulator, LytTR family n=1 Tax=Flavobacterium caeni TaxID=490189 RepID=A0A1G5JPK7_9FLAO|nr:LytTR family DNA-binding domain-containing protein [Flavobacterium caeni]SCY90267.1 two component transcriptional regulator, LytTR family [Flavobacterium caeni]